VYELQGLYDMEVRLVEALGVDPRRRDNLLVDALLEEQATYDELVAADDLRNARYVAAGTKTERIEITAYEGLLRTARKADLDDAVTDPLEDNLDEEKTLKKLKAMSPGPELKALWTKLTG